MYNVNVAIFFTDTLHRVEYYNPMPALVKSILYSLIECTYQRTIFVFQAKSLSSDVAFIPSIACNSIAKQRT